MADTSEPVLFMLRLASRGASLSASDVPSVIPHRHKTGSALGGSRSIRIYEALHDAILDHRLAPGTRLPEDEIGTVFGVSRTIVRAALQSLAHERVVTIQPNRGAQVAHPSVEEARQVFEARSLIEPRIAALAAERATPRDIAALRRHHREEENAIRGDNRRSAIALSARFHNMLAAIADQTILEGFTRELTSRSSLVVALYWRRKDTACERHAHHELLDAVAAHNARRAADLMRSHLVDIFSGLDLREHPMHDVPLADVLGPRQTLEDHA
jgi:DNA-binding GntR family transcriptional regulator